MLFSDNTKTSLASWSLKRVTQRFENATDIIENFSPVNDLQSDHGNPWRPLCILWSSFIHWTVNVNKLFPSLRWYLYCLRSDRWYSPIPGSILLSAMLFNSSMIVHLCDLVTCCAALMCSHRVGPEYHIYHADEQIPLLAILLNLPLWRTQETPFQSTSYVKTVDAIRVSSRNSDYVLTSRSKD
jgi:hypothetical protein